MGKSIWLEEPGGSSVFIGLSNAEEPGFIRSSWAIAVGNKRLGVQKCGEKKPTLRIYDVIIFPYKGPRQLFMLVYKH